MDVIKFNDGNRWIDLEEVISFQLNDENRFKNESFVKLNIYDGVYIVIGEYKKRHLPVGMYSKMKLVQSYIFSKSEGWTLEKAKSWIKRHFIIDGE